MSNKDTDILLIRKYLNGELDARAMHQLERRAQADPFLMDALEGYEKAGKEQQDQLAEIFERLQQRINRKGRRIIPWKTLSIAASVLIAVTIGGLLMFNKKTVTKQQIAQVVVAPKVVNTIKQDTILTVDKSASALKPEPLLAKQLAHVKKNGPIATSSTLSTASVNEIASADVSKVAKADKDTSTPLNEVIVMGYTTQRKKEVTASVATVSPGDKNPSTDSPANALQGQVAGLKVASYDNFNKSARSLPKNRINGRVIAKDDGQPLVGATVRIKGTTRSSVTNINGKFSISADSGKTNSLVVAYIGYNTTEVVARASDSLKSIALVPAGATLSEVVVTGYGANRVTDTNGETLIIDAHPINGWSSLQKYFNENAVSPDGKKGVVKLSFMVDHNGNISGIIVLKSVSVETDAKAIDLLNNGPGWVGSTSGRSESVTVRVKFTK